MGSCNCICSKVKWVSSELPLGMTSMDFLLTVMLHLIQQLGIKEDCFFQVKVSSSHKAVAL